MQHPPCTTNVWMNVWTESVKWRKVGSTLKRLVSCVLLTMKIPSDMQSKSKYYYYYTPSIFLMQSESYGNNLLSRSYWWHGTLLTKALNQSVQSTISKPWFVSNYFCTRSSWKIPRWISVWKKVLSETWATNYFFIKSLRFPGFYGVEWLEPSYWSYLYHIVKYKYT